MNDFSTSPESIQLDALRPHSIRQIIQAIYAEKDLSPAKVKKILKEAQVKQEELMPWAQFDHDPRESYGRKMVFDGGFFEMMVMSWSAGDFSAIHDHGYSQWGAVQVFGAAEHAVFLVQDDAIQTLSRNIMKPGQVIGVGHQLVHQMGNPQDGQKYLSLHVYGSYEREQDVTGDARLFDLLSGEIQRIDGGVFFALSPNEIKKSEPGPEADFLTALRHRVEFIRRLQKIQVNDSAYQMDRFRQATHELFAPRHWDRFISDLQAHITDQGHQNHSVFWKLLNWELQKAAILQNELSLTEEKEDSFQHYADLYDEVIGKPCRDGFMADYIRFFQSEYQVDFSQKNLLSIGCGTGLMEVFMMEAMGLKKENLLGIDLSEAMVKVAAQYIPAEVGNALELDPKVQMWDLTYCGLNVFQYLDHQFLEQVIQQTARITRLGGYFFGDFITPDHIRWYPNVIQSDCGNIISLRTPELIEKDNHMYQRSSIINVNRRSGQMRITYEGRHERFLPPLSRVRHYFQEAFGGKVAIYDAISKQIIQNQEDTCPSTRYLLVAQKA